MKKTILFFKLFSIFIITFSCSDLSNKGMYEVTLIDKDKKDENIKTYSDGTIYLKDNFSLMKVFPNSEISNKNNKFELQYGKTIYLKGIFSRLSKYNDIGLDEKMYLTNRLGYAQFIRIKLPYYLENTNSSIIIDYFINDEKKASLESKLNLIFKNEYGCFYGAFFPYNCFLWKIDYVIATINIIPDKNTLITIKKKIKINANYFREDIVYFDREKSKDFFNYDRKKIRDDLEDKLKIWIENNSLNYLFNGYNYPVKGAFHYSSLFGDGRILKTYDGKIMADSTHHSGLDIPKPSDNRAYAACDGIVRYTKFGDLYGNTVIVENGFSFFTTYYHLDKILVHEGDKVRKNDVIGIIGNTGNSTGAHLHWETRIKGIPIDPRAFFDLEEVLNF